MAPGGGRIAFGPRAGQKVLTLQGAMPREKGAARVSVHFHPKKTFGAKLLKGLIDDTGWSDDDLRRLKLVE